MPLVWFPYMILRLCALVLFFYLQAGFAAGASFFLEFFNSSYLLALNVQVDHTDLRVLNLYNISWDPARAVLPGKALSARSTPTLVLGDFNIQYPTANPARYFKPEELALSRPWFDRASLTGYSLINTPGEYTYFPPNQTNRPSVLDLAFANQSLLNLAPKWTNDLPPTGSDHTAPGISFSRGDPFTSTQSPNWDHINWEQIEDQLKALTFPPPPEAQAEVEEWYNTSSSTLIGLLKSNMVPRRPSKWSKRWWTPDLTQLRRIFHSTAQAAKKDPSKDTQAKLAKNTYFHAITVAKR